MDKWISVEDRLPEQQGYFLVYMPDWGYEKVITAYRTLGCWHTGDAIVTHWQPLPEPPEEDNG